MQKVQIQFRLQKAPVKVIWQFLFINAPALWIDVQNTSKWQSCHWRPNEEGILGSAKVLASELECKETLCQPQNNSVFLFGSFYFLLLSSLSLSLSASPVSPSVCWILKQRLAVCEHCNEILQSQKSCMEQSPCLTKTK